MGIPHADIVLESIFPKRRLEVKALVDSGSVFLAVPQHIALQLGFGTEEVGTREIILADGSRKAVPMIGPLRAHFADRYCDLSALVVGEEPLLGAVPMEMMDLILHPSSQQLAVNQQVLTCPWRSRKRRVFAGARSLRHGMFRPSPRTRLVTGVDSARITVQRMPPCRNTRLGG